VNGSIEIHGITSTSAAHPSAADGKKLQLVLAQRSGAQQRAAQRMCERPLMQIWDQIRLVPHSDAN